MANEHENEFEETGAAHGQEEDYRGDPRQRNVALFGLLGGLVFFGVLIVALVLYSVAGAKKPAAVAIQPEVTNNANNEPAPPRPRGQNMYGDQKPADPCNGDQACLAYLASLNKPQQSQQPQAQSPAIQRHSAGHAAALDWSESDMTASRITAPVESRTAEGPQPGSGAFAQQHEDDDPARPRDVKTYKCNSLCEGDYIQTVLVNRVVGDADGPIDAEVTTPNYTHDTHEVLIPQGARLHGTITAVKMQNQYRLYSAFHSIRYPDGTVYSLDQFKATDQQGAVGLTDLVNHHYLRIFGTASVIAGVATVSQIGNNFSGFAYDPLDEARLQGSQTMGQIAMQVLQQQLSQILPTIVLREGKNFINVYVRNNLNIRPGL